MSMAWEHPCTALAVIPVWLSTAALFLALLSNGIIPLCLSTDVSLSLQMMSHLLIGPGAYTPTQAKGSISWKPVMFPSGRYMTTKAD